MRLAGDRFTKNKHILIRYGQLYAEVAFFRLVTAVMSRNATWTGTMILLMQPLGVHYRKGCLKLLVNHGMHYLLQLVLDEQTSPSSIFDFIKLRIAQGLSSSFFHCFPACFMMPTPHLLQRYRYTDSSSESSAVSTQTAPFVPGAVRPKASRREIHTEA